MSESKYNHRDELLGWQLILPTLRYKKESRDFATKPNQQLRQLQALLIQFQKNIQECMLSQGTPWSLWMDNRIKSKIL